MTRSCAVYGVTPVRYDAWRRRPESAHAAQDRQLTQRIVKIFRAHRGCYGSPRIHEALQQTGWQVSRRRVARLMRAAGLRARVVRTAGPVVNTRVTIRLEPHTAGARLVLEHSGFDSSQPWSPQVVRGADVGWATMLGRLTSVGGAA